MKRKFKQRTFKNPVNIDPPTELKKFITPDPKSFIKKSQHWVIGLKVVHERTIQMCPEVPCHLFLLSRFELDRFLDIDDVVDQEDVKLFYGNIVYLEVLRGIEPILRSHLLGTPIEFSLSNHHEILDLPNEGDHAFFFACDKPPAFGKNDADVFLSSRMMVRRPQLPPA